MMVKFFLCAVIAAFAHVVVAYDAPERPDQPNDVIISGYFYNVKRQVEGGVAFWSDDGWTRASVHLFGRPGKAGPFSYSINTDALTERNVCSEAGGILDPYGGTKDAPTWAGMMIGDLSGKHGKIDTLDYHSEYEDHYLAIRDVLPHSGLLDRSYIGNRAFVLTDRDNIDFACGNLLPHKRLGKMVDMNGEKVPEEFYSMLMEAKKTN